MSKLKALVVARNRGVAVITLNRPDERLNAMNHARIAEMHQVLDDLADDDRIVSCGWRALMVGPGWAPIDIYLYGGRP